MRYDFLFAVLLITAPYLLLPSANAQMPYEAENIRITCFQIEGLEKRLKKVVDEQQVFNNDRKTWHSKNGCSIDSPDLKFTTDAAEARNAGASRKRSSGLGFIGWIVTDDWLVPIERVFQLKGRFVAYRPATIYSRDTFTLPKRCFEHTIKHHGVALVGHQFSAGNIVDDALKQLCSAPKIKNADNE